MEPTRMLRSGLATLLVLGSGVQAQQTGSTLWQMSQRADAIAQVRVLGREHSAQSLELHFKLQHKLKGELPARFSLHETARRACGQALHGLMVGQSLLGFFSHSASGPRLLLSSNRALVPLRPGVLQHTRALLQAEGSAQVQLLARGLQSPDHRVQRDAALSLPRHPALQGLDARGRQLLLDGLGQKLALGESSALALLEASRRLRLSSALDQVLPAYLEGKHLKLEAPLRAAISELGEAEALAWLSRELPRASRRAQARAIPLLEDCSLGGADWCLRGLELAPSRAVAEAASAARKRRQKQRVKPTRDRFRSILKSTAR